MANAPTATEGKMMLGGKKTIQKPTSKIENSKNFAQISHREIVTIADSGCSDNEKPDDVTKPKGAFVSGIFIIMERIPLILQKVEESTSPTYEAKYVGEKLHGIHEQGRSLLLISYILPSFYHLQLRKKNIFPI